MKTCGHCGIEKTLDEFHKRGTGHQPWCKACKKERDAERFKEQRPRLYQVRQAYRERMLAWAQDLKRGPCTDCSETFHPFVMDWDHLGDKDRDVADLIMKGWSKRRILEEIAKCELVCSNCHRMRTWSRAHPEELAA